MRHARLGDPARVVGAALARLEAAGLTVRRGGRPLGSRAVGPSLRRYANAAAVVETDLAPPELLALCKAIEREFGRRARGQRWSARVLDLDLVLWSGGAWCSPGLTIPHPAFRTRDFVLRPALPLPGPWRDPLTGLGLRHLHHRLTRPKPVRRAAAVVGPVAQ